MDFIQKERGVHQGPRNFKGRWEQTPAFDSTFYVVIPAWHGLAWYWHSMVLAQHHGKKGVSMRFLQYILTRIY
jgi:hypothetical protein